MLKANIRYQTINRKASEHFLNVVVGLPLIALNKHQDLDHINYPLNLEPMPN